MSSESNLEKLPREAQKTLHAQGLMVKPVTEQKLKLASSWSLLERPARYTNQLASAIQDLSTLFGIEIGLVESLETITSQFKGRFHSF